MEESDHWPRGTTELVFGDTHHIQEGIFDAVDFGFANHRRRYWAVLLHKAYLLDVYSNLRNVMPLFARTCAHTWHEYFVDLNTNPAIRAELISELDWAKARPKSCAKGQNIDALPDRDKYLAAMRHNERTWVQINSARWPGCISMANQNSDSVFGICSKDDTTMYTIVKSATLHYSDHHRRWMSGTEMLIAIGIPAISRLADPLGLPAVLSSFCVEHRTTLGDQRTRNRKVEAAGNSMNPSIAAFCLLYALLWTSRSDDSLFFACRRCCHATDSPLGFLLVQCMCLSVVVLVLGTRGGR
jgi:hypothetical protein